MRAHLAMLGLVGLLGLAGCPDEAGAQTSYCPTPWGVGPEYTDGVCAPSFLCVPNTYVSCAANDCCQYFCAAPGGCGANVPCVYLTPEEVPAFATPGCDCTVADAGEDCICADGGAPCYFADCLGVCSN